MARYINRATDKFAYIDDFLQGLEDQKREERRTQLESAAALAIVGYGWQALKKYRRH